MRILPSAHRHGVADDDIRHALRYWRWQWEGSDDVAIYIGPARDARYLEIGVILDEDREWIVIHAMQARQKYVP